MATIYEVSKLAGVSLATVSRVINNNPKVRESTRDKVLAAMSELDYRPSYSARSLATNRSNCIGLLITELGGPYFGDLMAGVEGALAQEGLHLIITTTHADAQKEQDGFDFLKDRQCDAIIAYCESLDDASLIELTSKSSIPIILIGRHIDSLASSCLYIDNEYGGYLATKALIDAGHTEIGYISGPLNKEDSRLRLKGHQRALAEGNITFNEQDLFLGDYHESSGHHGFLALSEQKDYTAIACGNDEMAAGVIKTAHELGYQLPEQLSVIGFDDVVFSSYLWPTLSTVSSAIKQLGQAAAEMAMYRAYGISTEPKQNMFTPQLVMRDSVTYPNHL